MSKPNVNQQTTSSNEHDEFRKEIEVRARIGRIFNKTLDGDFGGDIAAFNNYVELQETYIANLVLENRVPETEAAIASYQVENQRSIALNAARAAALNRANIEAAALAEKTRREALLQNKIQESKNKEAVERVKKYIRSVLLGETTISESEFQLLYAQMKDLNDRLAKAQQEIHSFNAASGNYTPFANIVPCSHVFPPKVLPSSDISSIDFPPTSEPLLTLLLEASGVSRSHIDSVNSVATLDQLVLRLNTP
jgi:hypothetical protein